MEPLSIAMPIREKGVSMNADRRMRLQDDELLYLRSLVVEDVIRKFSKNGWKEKRMSLSLVRTLEGSVGGGRAGRYGEPLGVWNERDALALRKLPKWVVAKISHT